MPHRVIQYPQAIADQDEIWLSIALDNETAANRVIDRFSEIVDLLSRHPEAGRRRDELRPGVRVCPVESYLIFYSVADDVVRIHRVLHGARNITRSLLDE